MLIILVLLYISSVNTFNEEEQSTLTNPIQQYQLIECEIEDQQCSQCTFVQMNEIKQCQISRQIQRMICYYQLGEDEEIRYPQVDYKACNLHSIGIFSTEFVCASFIMVATLLSWYFVSKEKDESERKLLYRILKN